MSSVAFTCDRVSLDFATATALDSVSFTVAEGERVALLGPSGAGKSSLLAIAAGLLPMSTGSAVTLGVNVSELPRRRHRPVRSQIGYLAQDYGLVRNARVITNLNAGRLGGWSNARALWSLARPQNVAEAVELLDNLELSGRLSDRTGDLSGGQQQRVAIARLLLQEPSLILADEPVSALDPGLTETALALLATKNSKRTLIASLHNPDAALAYFDRLIGLRSGSIVFDLAVGEVGASELDDLYNAERSTSARPSRSPAADL